MEEAALNNIQEIFWRSLVTSNPDDSDLLGHLTDDNNSASDRMKIYCDGYFLRILKVLKEDFHNLHHSLGNEEFTQLVREYMKETPSDHFSLSHIGERFPLYIMKHSINHRYPWAGELAQFDWARAALFESADHPVFFREALNKIPRVEWPKIKLQLIPPLIFLQTKYRIEQWVESASVQPELRTETIKVWRKEEDIYYNLVTADEVKMFELVRSGLSMEVICEKMAAQNENVETIAEKVFTILSKWLDDQLIAGFTK